MSFEDMIDHILKQDDRHSSNNVKPDDSTTKHQEATLIPQKHGGFIREYTHKVQTSRNTGGNAAKKKMDMAPIIDKETAFGDEGKE